MAKTRVKIQSASIPQTEVSPVWGAEFSYIKEKDDVFYKHEPKDSLGLKGADFDLVEALTDECEKITVTVERLCNGIWGNYWTGFFSKFDCRFDYGGVKVANCFLQAKLTKDDKFDCFYKSWENEVNFYANSPTIIVKPFQGTYEIMPTVCSFCADQTPPVCDDGVACIEYVSSNIAAPGDPPCNPGVPYIKRIYHRIVGVGTPTTPPPYDTGWTYLSGNDWWRCPGDPNQGPLKVSPMKYGRRFNETLIYLVSQLNCGLTLRSHFFNINATHAAPPSNIAYTFATNYCKDITIHRKSDVKRPDSSDPSKDFIWNIKLKDVLNDLKKMFQVFWTIEGNDMILEHISYFEGQAGADYSAKPMKLELEYEQDTPKQDLYFWSDERASPFFMDIHHIVYGCGNGNRENRVQLFSTDVEFIQNIENHEEIADQNWVLISCKIVGGQYYANTASDLVNEPFRWITLLSNLHKHNRPFGKGEIGGNPVTFLSVQKLKKQPAFVVGLCCDEVFDPKKTITTLLGAGQIQSATENIEAETLELNLNY